MKITPNYLQNSSLERIFRIYYKLRKIKYLVFKTVVVLRE